VKKGEKTFLVAVETGKSRVLHGARASHCMGNRGFAHELAHAGQQSAIEALLEQRRRACEEPVQGISSAALACAPSAAR
jgi:hypothetical protein